MKKFTFNFFLMIIILIIYSCGNKNKKILFNTKYSSYTAETEWEYTFLNNGKFIFQCEGHYGFVKDTGIYSIHDSIILLSPGADIKNIDFIIQNRFIIINQNCLRDYFDDYYVTENYKPIDSVLSLKYDFDDTIDSIIMNLPFTKDKIKPILTNHLSDKFWIQPKLYPTGLKFENGVEYRMKSLEYEDNSDGFQMIVLAYFLIREKPFAIYEYHLNTKRVLLFEDRNRTFEYSNYLNKITNH